jgi:hypothetical protein
MLLELSDGLVPGYGRHIDESLDQRRIELRPGCPFQLGARYGGGNAAPMRPVTRERRERIEQGQQSRDQRNGLTR